MAKKQLEVARVISQNNISLFALLGTKVKCQGLDQLYQRICPSWCSSNNLHHHKNGRIFIGWKHEV